MLRQLESFSHDRKLPNNIYREELNGDQWDGIAFIPTRNTNRSYPVWLDDVRIRCNQILNWHSNLFEGQNDWRILVFTDGSRTLHDIGIVQHCAHKVLSIDTYMCIRFELGGLDIYEIQRGYKPHSIQTGHPIAPSLAMEPGGILFILTLLILNGGIHVPMSIICGGAEFIQDDQQKQMPHISVLPKPDSSGGIIALNLHGVDLEEECAGMASAMFI